MKHGIFSYNYNNNFQVKEFNKMVTLKNFEPFLSNSLESKSPQTTMGKFDGIKTAQELFGNIDKDLGMRITDFRWKSWTWGQMSSGDCACGNAQLVINTEGVLGFSCILTSSSDNDAWGLHFNWYQSNGLFLGSTPQIFSPTINGQEWSFQSAYPAYLFDSINGVTMTHRC